MPAPGALDSPGLIARSRRTSSLWSLLACCLLVGSGGLQLWAAAERWVVGKAEWNRADISVEDHRFDYAYPAEPWESLGSAALLFGVGILLLALGVVAASRGSSSRDSTLERVLVIVVVVSFAVTGAHALVSGIIGAPTVMQFPPLLPFLGLGGFVGLLGLAVRWMRSSSSLSVTCLLLLGATMPGYFVASFGIAPVLVGYQSHDTTPWTEAVAAVVTAAAGMVLGMRARLLRKS